MSLSFEPQRLRAEVVGAVVVVTRRRATIPLATAFDFDVALIFLRPMVIVLSIIPL